MKADFSQHGSIPAARPARAGTVPGMAKTFPDMWREYGRRPPAERWVSRVAMLVGLAAGAAWLVLAARVAWSIYLWCWRRV